MSVNLIGSTANTATPNNPAAALGQNDFLKILMTQLTYQDPLKPLDNEQFIAQMAQFTTLEQVKELNDKLDSMLSSQGVMQSFGLMGKNVNYQTISGSNSGQVISVAFTNGEPLLSVKGADGNVSTQIKLSTIISLSN